MKRGIKRLIWGGLALASITAGSSVSIAQELPKNLNIPKRFENYRIKGTKSRYKGFPLYGAFFYTYLYDINGDGYADVMELFPELYKEGPIISDKPLFYIFDLNGNKILFEEGEVLYDEKMDDLNYNEIWGEEYQIEWFEDDEHLEEHQRDDEELKKHQNIEDMVRKISEQNIS